MVLSSLARARTESTPGIHPFLENYKSHDAPLIVKPGANAAGEWTVHDGRLMCLRCQRSRWARHRDRPPHKHTHMFLFVCVCWLAAARWWAARHRGHLRSHTGHRPPVFCLYAAAATRHMSSGDSRSRLAVWLAVCGPCGCCDAGKWRAWNMAHPPTNTYILLYKKEKKNLRLILLQFSDHREDELLSLVVG